MRPERNILLVNWNDRTNPWAGGAEIHLHETFSRIAARGHRVTLLCSGYGGAPAEDALDGMRVVRAGDRYTFNFVLPRVLARRFRGERFDVVVEALNKVPLCTPLFARVVPIAEMAAGVALICGFEVRLTAAAALAMVLNFHFASDVLFHYAYLTNGYGPPVVGGLLALAMGGVRLPLSVSK